MIHCVSIFSNMDNLTFSDEFCPKTNLDFGIQKTNAGIRISFQKIPCLSVFTQNAQNAQLWLFWSKFAQNWTLGLEFQNVNVGIRVSILEIPCMLIFRQNRQLWLFEPKFAQKWILGSEFEKVWIRNQLLQHTLWANFQSKWTTLNFST